MIGAQGRVPVFAYRRPVDLRKGFEGLSALVQQALGRDPLSGALYLFTNRRRTTAKVLQFDGTGLTLYIKRLARGRFAALWNDDDATTLSLSPTPGGQPVGSRGRGRMGVFASTMIASDFGRDRAPCIRPSDNVHSDVVGLSDMMGHRDHARHRA